MCAITDGFAMKGQRNPSRPLSLPAVAGESFRSSDLTPVFSVFRFNHSTAQRPQHRNPIGLDLTPFSFPRLFNHQQSPLNAPVSYDI